VLLAHADDQQQAIHTRPGRHKRIKIKPTHTETQVITLYTMPMTTTCLFIKPKSEINHTNATKNIKRIEHITVQTKTIKAMQRW
jgi:hypothetical protein